MPQSASGASRKSAVKKGVKKTTSSKKRPVKKQGSRGSAGAGKKRTSQKRKKKKSAWWSGPVCVLMLIILGCVGAIVAKETSDYESFKIMRTTVSFDGFYPGVLIDGEDVGGKQLEEVLSVVREREESAKRQVSLSLVCGNQVWNVTPDDLDYQTDYEEVVRDAYQLGREGTVRDRYEAIQRLKQSGAVFYVTRGYDENLLRIITDQIADELSYDVVNATVKEFDLSTLSFTFEEGSEGRYVDAEQLYQSALTALRSGVGGQTIAVSQQVIKPSATKAELESQFGMITEARTSTSGSTENRITNIELALKTLNGTCIEPGETFSFNGTVGQRTTDRGYKMAGAFSSGMATQEVGGGICQVSTTLFNAVVKADLEVTERQPHSRPINYVDEGKDAAVSWPNQDFKFTNNTDFPVYIIAGMSETKNRCIISIYGRQLPDGTSIKIESEILEKTQPEDDRYIYTSELPTGQKKLIENAREGIRAVAYKVYLDADENEIRREVLCYSNYAAAGAVYKVGQ